MPPLSPRRIIASTASAGFFAPLNSSMLAVALPRIRDDFGVGVGLLALLVSVYLVAVAVAQPVAGKLGDSLGHRRMVLAGLGLLFASSLMAAGAWAFWTLMLARVFQGLAAAMIMPNCTAYLRAHIDERELGRSMGYNGAAISAGAAMGPVIGGLVVAAAGWRWMFLVNVPAAIFAAVLVFTLERDAARRAITGIDAPSIVILLAGFAGLAILGNAARFENPVLTLAAAAVLPVALVAYGLLYRARRRGVVELRLFSRVDYAVAATSTALSNLVMYTILLAMPLYLDELRGVGEAAIGVLLFSLSVASVVVSPFSGGLADRIGYRRPLLFGSTILVVASTGLASIIGHFPPWAVAVPLGAIGIAMSFCMSGAGLASLRAWGTEVAGAAAGTQSMMRYVGSVAGAAMMAGILGSTPDLDGMRILMWLVCVAATLNLAVALGAFRAKHHVSDLVAPVTA